MQELNLSSEGYLHSCSSDLNYCFSGNVLITDTWMVAHFPEHNRTLCTHARDCLMSH